MQIRSLCCVVGLSLAVGCPRAGQIQEPSNTTESTAPAAGTATVSTASDNVTASQTSEGSQAPVTDSTVAPTVTARVVTPSAATAPAVSPVPTAATQRANAIAVIVTGSEHAYTFNVTLKSPDTGCALYADWWEVVTLEGTLVYRRVLGHSHVDEQPFTRSGGPVEVDGDTPLIVRGHMNTSGYGGVVQRGTASGGFSADTSVDASFASDLGSVDPQPSECAF